MPENELELKTMLADARLEVAENLGWTCCAVALPGLYAYTASWIITILGAGAIYWLATYKHRRDANAAEDAFYKHAGLGKYFVSNKEKNDGSTE